MPVWLDGVLTCILPPTPKAGGALLNPGCISITWNLKLFLLALRHSFLILLLFLFLSGVTIFQQSATLIIKAELGLSTFANCPWISGNIAFPTIFGSKPFISAGLITPVLTHFLVTFPMIMTIFFLSLFFPPYTPSLIAPLTLTFLLPACITIYLDTPPACLTMVLSSLMHFLCLGQVICTFFHPYFCLTEFWISSFMITAFSPPS